VEYRDDYESVALAYGGSDSNPNLNFPQQYRGGSMSNHHNPSFLTDLLAGSITAATTKTAAAPLERVKLLMQTQAANRDLVVPYRHTWDCVVRVAREQGWRSFWRGNVASVLRYFPQQAFTFATKDTFQRWFSSPAHTTWWHRALANLAAGGLAGGVTLLAAYPLDVVRTRMATDVRRADGGMLLRNCVRQMWADGGVGAFYRGLPVALTGVVVFKVVSAVIFFSFFFLKTSPHTHIFPGIAHGGLRHGEKSPARGRQRVVAPRRGPSHHDGRGHVVFPV
jgi:solute carrier family 25 (adenine nucleotide translocator) protein 4/5/6/31